MEMEGELRQIQSELAKIDIAFDLDSCTKAEYEEKRAKIKCEIARKLFDGESDFEEKAETREQQNLEEKSTVKFLTWNIDAFRTSSRGKITIQDKYKLIIEVISECDPDLLVLQEVNPEFDKIFLSETSYRKVCSKGSHSGCTFIYTKRNLFIDQISFDGVIIKSREKDIFNIHHLYGDAPIATVEITLPSGKKFFFSGAHLSSGKDGAKNREWELSTIKLDERPHILIGDLNVREAENDYIFRLGWKDATNKRDYTWNSMINQYHQNGFGFTCRFDRILYHNVDSPTYTIIGNNAIGNDAHCYLSDHFGLLANFMI